MRRVALFLRFKVSRLGFDFAGRNAVTSVMLKLVSSRTLAQTVVPEIFDPEGLC
jgi:hypothetical protein